MEKTKDIPGERGPGATDEQIEKSGTIRGSEVLGYEGAGREEHSGQNDPDELTSPDDLADIAPKDITGA